MTAVPQWRGLWELDVLHVPVPGKGHDFWDRSPSAVVVVDGATPLDESWPQDIASFAREIASRISAACDARGNDTIERIFKDTITELHEQFPPAGHKRTAGVTVARIHGDLLELALLGDLVAVAVADDGLHVVSTSRLAELDEMARQDGTRAALLANRKLANVDSGYWVFGDDPGAANHLVVTQLPLASVQAVLLASDGYLRGHSTPESALDEALSQGLRAPTMDAQAAGLAGPDDATAVLLRRLAAR